jgi:hypothetical protein
VYLAAEELIQRDPEFADQPIERCDRRHDCPALQLGDHARRDADAPRELSKAEVLAEPCRSQPSAQLALDPFHVGAELPLDVLHLAVIARRARLVHSH